MIEIQEGRYSHCSKYVDIWLRQCGYLNERLVWRLRFVRESKPTDLLKVVNANSSEVFIRVKPFRSAQVSGLFSLSPPPKISPSTVRDKLNLNIQAASRCIRNQMDYEERNAMIDAATTETNGVHEEHKELPQSQQPLRWLENPPPFTSVAFMLENPSNFACLLHHIDELDIQHITKDLDTFRAKLAELMRWDETISTQKVSRLLNKLQNDGWVQPVVGNRNRYISLEVTEKGKPILFNYRNLCGEKAPPPPSNVFDLFPFPDKAKGFMQTLEELKKNRDKKEELELMAAELRRDIEKLEKEYREMYANIDPNTLALARELMNTL